MRKHLPMTLPFIQATDSQVQTSKILGRLRKEQHDKHRSPEDDQGEASNLAGDIRGVLGELLVLEPLEFKGFDPKGWVGVHEGKAPIGPDFVMGGMAGGARYSVKTSRPGCDWIYYSERQQLARSKAFDLLICVVFITETDAVVCAPIPAADVGDDNKWMLRTGKNGSQYRSIATSKLRHLWSWDKLPGSPSTPFVRPQPDIIVPVAHTGQPPAVVHARA